MRVRCLALAASSATRRVRRSERTRSCGATRSAHNLRPARSHQRVFARVKKDDAPKPTEARHASGQCRVGAICTPISAIGFSDVGTGRAVGLVDARDDLDSVDTLLGKSKVQTSGLQGGLSERGSSENVLDRAEDTEKRKFRKLVWASRRPFSSQAANLALCSARDVGRNRRLAIRERRHQRWRHGRRALGNVARTRNKSGSRGTVR